jgi:hypothetical protein
MRDLGKFKPRSIGREYTLVIPTTVVIELISRIVFINLISEDGN